MTKRSFLNTLFWVIPLLCALVLYANSVNLPFFSDDIPTQRYLTTASFADIWQKVDMNGTYYRPFANLFYKYVPLNAPLWHSIMIWVHLLNTVLTGVLARQLGLPRRGQWLAMMLYAVFPFTAQTVLWVGAGFHLLLTVLVLSASVASLQWLTTQRKIFGLFAFVCGFLAPFSHESGVLTPLLLVLLIGAKWGIRGTLTHWKSILVLLIPIGIGSVLYWVLRANALGASASFTFALDRVGVNLAFFAQGLSLPTQFIFGLLSGDAMVRAYLATALWLIMAVGIWLFRKQKRFIWQGVCYILFCLVALAPAYVLLHPDYVRYGERLIGVAVPVMVILTALILQVLPRFAYVITSALLIVVCVLFSQEYVYLHQLHATAYNTLFGEMATISDDDAPLLFINLPSQIESKHYPLPLTHANAGLLTDWLELRDFLWLNLNQREFTNVSYAYVPEYYPELVGYRQRVYGNLTAPQDLPNLFAQHTFVWRTHLIDNAFHIDLMGSQTISKTATPYIFGEQMALHDVAWQLQPNGRLRVALAWEKLSTNTVNETPFVHILCDGVMIAQADDDPLDNLYAFSLWQTGETWTDMRYIPNITVNPTCLQIRVGLYNRSTQARTPITQNGQALSDEWVIFGN